MHFKGCYFLIFFIIFSFIYLLRLKASLKFAFNSSDRIKISARLTQEPILQDTYQIFKIKGIFVKTNRFPEFHYGDHLVIIGNIKKKVINLNFDQFWLINPQIVKVKADSIELSALSSLFKFRHRLEEVFNRTLSEPQASLLIGIILGIQKSMPQQFYQALKTTGTLHIIVASGMNISLTAGLLRDFLAKFLKRRTALVISLVCIFIYCVMVGMGPPIVRAGLMAAILYLANFSGREMIGLWILILVAAVMFLFNPLLLFDVGFQLSFSATAGLITIAPFFQRIFNRIKVFKLISSDLAETIAAQIFTLPILVITFGHFNPLAIIPNIFVLWLIQYLMVLGLLIGFLGLIIFPLAQLLSCLCWLPLTYFVKIIGFFGQFRFFDLKLEGLSWIFGLGYYLILLSLLRSRIGNALTEGESGIN